MVAPLLAFWNPARQASIADSWALEPAPSSLPERLLVPLLELLVDSLPAPQAERAKPRARAAALGAAMRRREVRFTSTPEFTVFGHPEPRNDKCPGASHSVNGR